jgi:phosphoribosylanthranilate isomerase
MHGWVKICGVTSVSDARDVLDAGADAIGLNFVSASPRVVDVAAARGIADAVRGRLRIVGVTASMELAAVRSLIDDVGLDLVQLHGVSQSAASGGREGTASSVTQSLAPKAYEAHAIGSDEDVERARRAPGALLLLDARARGVLGGTGTTFDWSLVVGLARERDVIVAGGLTPENVGAAIVTVEPWGVDVASGVEIAADRRSKDPEKVARFVANARAAWRGLG